MAIPFRRSIDMTLKFINNFRLQHVAGDHSSTDTGTFYYDSTANRPAVRTNSAYKRMAFTDDVPGAGELDAADINYDNGAASDLDATDVQAAIEELEDEKATPSDISSAISTHAGQADPHTVYQKESEKGSANGYASLDSGGKIPDGEIPAGIARDSEVTTAISNVIGGASAAYDTLLEIQTFLEEHDTDVAALLTAVNERGKVLSYNVGDNSATSFTFTHNLNTRDIVPSLRTVASPWVEVGAEIDFPSVNTVRVQFDSPAPATDEYRLTIVGRQG